MPSLRKRVTSYFRQLSFHNDPSSSSSASTCPSTINQNTFVTKYLQGHYELRQKSGPAVLHGKTPSDLPNYELGQYEIGPGTIVGCYTGPRGGLTTVKRQEKHLSVPDAEDIDFIDTASKEDEEKVEIKRSPQKKFQHGQPVDNATMMIKVAGVEYCVTNRAVVPKGRKHSKSHSLGSLSDFGAIVIEKTKILNDEQQLIENNNNVNGDDGAKGENKENEIERTKAPPPPNELSKSKSEGNPFRHSTNKKRGRIIKIASDEIAQASALPSSSSTSRAPATQYRIDDTNLPAEWQRKSEFIYGLSDSLYDKNQSTRKRNGNPIADCFGVIARENSAILAMADGVNWGEKAAVAAKSAIHGALYYLNKTIFMDCQPFDEMNVRKARKSDVCVKTTREIFVCLLRAFSCAHELILENNGMLTTLTVACVVPLKKRRDDKQGVEQRFVCCVCNVGDTLAYIYSKRHGLREMTKGSHDVNCNRDMRDALGALGPVVDGINPELSNLTLSMSTLNAGDVVMIASDGLTDNFDPNVCKFTVSQSVNDVVERQARAAPPMRHTPQQKLLFRSKTSVDMPSRRQLNRNNVRRGDVKYHIERNSDGLAFVTPVQRYELQLLLMEDVLRNGLNGEGGEVVTAQKLCENLVNFTFSMTAAKRHSLEEREIYFDEKENGVMVEVSQQEQKMRRKKCMERVQDVLPGKLDHVSVVAWNVGNKVAS